LSKVVALYCDGGVIGRNPSPVGVTYAWCAVDDDDARVQFGSGVIPARAGGTITNNVTEYIAAVKALEAMPDGWNGTLYSDSQVTLGRIFWGWQTSGLPANAIDRCNKALDRLGRVWPVLLQGHPTRADLESGVGAKRGYPVSKHNVFCDQECGRQGREYQTQGQYPAQGAA
jgi:ribonuclease HI